MLDSSRLTNEFLGSIALMLFYICFYQAQITRLIRAVVVSARHDASSAADAIVVATASVSLTSPAVPDEFDDDAQRIALARWQATLTPDEYRPLDEQDALDTLAMGAAIEGPTAPARPVHIPHIPLDYALDDGDD